MGLIGNVLTILFGRSGNLVRETAEVFRENTEAAAIRDSDAQQAAIDAFRAEFIAGQGGWFNRFMDGVNRVPRPALALSTLALFAAAMISPDWFAARMEGVAVVPEPLWWLMGVVVSFYFGARYQVKGQEFQRAIAASLMRDLETARVQSDRGKPPSVFRPEPLAPQETVQAARAGAQVDITDNAALADWQESSRGL
ncbi:Holin of 3TMs, for gene-transfer release [Aliiroseovarius sediminilitoris]|uniref:Holin of 3TMs, for gene-transfer release n=1 Tax=Aliiroseovarius sediminilitoris TaxID=1173584 RepID=A0A1I0P1S6_9RHOB|nr:holin family protein [Aliiroseovarius sediminilitoris]SEW08300.1 Holin of 3TMs, for gene-transfer release [Aliiroseovarius sediminilitoris]